MIRWVGGLQLPSECTQQPDRGKLSSAGGGLSPPPVESESDRCNAMHHAPGPLYIDSCAAHALHTY